TGWFTISRWLPHTHRPASNLAKTSTLRSSPSARTSTASTADGQRAHCGPRRYRGARRSRDLDVVPLDVGAHAVELGAVPGRVHLQPAELVHVVVLVRGAFLLQEDELGRFLVERLVVALVGLGLDLDARLAVLDHLGQELGDVRRPEHVPDREAGTAGDRLRVRPVDHEHVREVRRHHAQVRAWTVLRPEVVDVQATLADEVGRPEVLHDREACRAYDHVHFGHGAVFGLDALRGPARDAVGDQVDVVARERLVP